MTDGRKEFDVAWAEVNGRLKGVTLVEGLDTAAVVTALLRLAAYLHLRNEGTLMEFELAAGANYETMQQETQSLGLNNAQLQYLRLAHAYAEDPDKYGDAADEAWRALTEAEREGVDAYLDKIAVKERTYTTMQKLADLTDKLEQELKAREAAKKEPDAN